LHSDELHDFCASPNIVRVIKIKDDEVGRSCTTHGADEKCMQSFGWKI